MDLEYEGLDPDASYKVRIVYAGSVPAPGRRKSDGHYVRLVADGSTELHPLMLKPYPVRPV